MPKNTARPDESEWRNIESGEVSYTKDFDSPIEASKIIYIFFILTEFSILRHSSSKDNLSWLRKLDLKLKKQHLMITIMTEKINPAMAEVKTRMEN